MQYYCDNTSSESGQVVACQVLQKLLDSSGGCWKILGLILVWWICR